MRHAVVGAGGIGCLLAAALARAGTDVLLLMRPQTLVDYEGRLAIESVASQHRRSKHQRAHPPRRCSGG